MLHHHRRVFDEHSRRRLITASVIRRLAQVIVSVVNHDIADCQCQRIAITHCRKAIALQTLCFRSEHKRNIIPLSPVRQRCRPVRAC